MFTKKFWLDAAERAAKTAAQALGLIVAGEGFDVLDADLRLVAGTVLTAVVLSLATSIASTAVGSSDDPSLLTK
jgi:hypothetical protein